ncbi:unnamed protein product [Cladocopium goreaui]|uniref:Protein translocase subunit SecA n=1 Tax=Cladocopium goreaui TaxID=2562237 RepID=A0A9P1CP68_9DINO|nr:unnamed protein product [Cladocopium goreaui]
MTQAVWRVLELWYFDVQLLGGLVLHKERLAEMKTGEGKTIVALLPTFLAALEDKGGVYVVTPNDYLARRDAENVGQVLRFLGLTVGLVQSTMEVADRQKAYKCDVVYLTNAELGFDYLRDNLAVYPHQVVQSKNFHFCLVDEADSILIDEARTPLIISESVPAVPRQFEAGREVANALKKDLHYTVDEKNMNVVMTDLGEKVAQDLLQVENLWEPEEAWILYVLNAVKAKELFQLGEEYIIRDGKVAIVDTFTGRVLEGRRWSDGMHQAIECKENISVSVRSQVSAQITYQSLFRLFPRLCAMTGTALTEAAEFEEIYGLRCTGVPTARPNVRRDYPDVVYKTEEAKLNAIVEEIVLNNERNGRPILIGTANVKMSEAIVSRLREAGVEPQLLNARPESIARENETISQAGRLGKVTVSTNMAGRGTDIILGGNHSQMAALNIRSLLADALLPMEESSKVYSPDEEFYPTDMPGDLEKRLADAVQGIAATPVGEETKTFLDVEELVASVGGEAPFEANESANALMDLRLLVLALLWCCRLLPDFLGGFGEEEKKGPPAKGEPERVEEQEVDWKDLAYQRQLERIANRKRKAQPNYKETAEERKVRLRKLAMWNAAQKKGMTDVVGRAETTVDIKVGLMKPLGIEFEKYDEEPNRAWVSGIFKDGSAFKNGEIEAGDFLFSVNGKEVDGMPYEEALQNIVDAEGEINLAFSELKTLYKDALAEEKDQVIKAGGLYVLGTTRHESRRIDNQLRGRAGRQGDPGTTRFFISLQDDVFRVFGGDKIETLMDRFRLGDAIPLQSPIVNDTLDRVQKAVEEFFKKTRTTLFEFDKVISKQRELTYKTRKEFLANKDTAVMKLIEEWGEDAVDFHIEQVKDKTDEEKAKEFEEYFGFDMPQLSADMKEDTPEAQEAARELLAKSVREGIQSKAKSYEEFRPGFAVEAARIATVVTIDDEWKALLQKMDALKQTVGLAAYKGSEPLKEYQVQGFKMYQKVENKYKAQSVSRWLRSKPKKDAQQS